VLTDKKLLNTAIGILEKTNDDLKPGCVIQIASGYEK
jgi:hypothetical protein